MGRSRCGLAIDTRIDLAIPSIIGKIPNFRITTAVIV